MDSGAGFPLGTGSSPDHAAMRVHSGQRLLAYQPKEGVWILFENWKPATLGSRAADTNHQPGSGLERQSVSRTTACTAGEHGL